MAGRPFFALAAILFLGLSLTACQPQTRAACPPGKLCLEYGNGADPQTLDPQLATATNESAILRELFDGLVTDAADGSPTPGAATSWETSQDGLVWTFHLRLERWSDGVPVTAHDFVYAYQRMLTPSTGSSYAYLLYVLKNAAKVNAGDKAFPPSTVGAKALDDETLQLTLEHPAPYLPQILKHQAMFPIPEHVVAKWGAAWVKPAHIVSNGAYRLIDWRLSDYVRIEKNPYFRDAGHVCFDRVDFYPTQDPVAAERRVLRGELDINAGIQSNRVRRLRSNPHDARYVHSHSYLATAYLIYNTRDVAPLRDRRVREAISMALDRQFITDKLLGAGQVPTTSFVPLGIADYLPRGAPHPRPAWADWSFPRRQAAAKQLLAEAGYSPAHPLQLMLKTFNSPISLLLTEALQNDLKPVGVDVSIRQEDGIVALQSFEIRDFQLGSVAWIADYNDPMTFLTLMRSDTGAQNYGDYKHPAYDALLNKADNEVDLNRRAQYLAQAEQMMLDDADVAPLLNSVNLNLINPHITGWTDNDTDIHPIRDLCRDDAPGRPIKTPS